MYQGPDKDKIMGGYNFKNHFQNVTKLVKIKIRTVRIFIIKSTSATSSYTQLPSCFCHLFPYFSPLFTKYFSPWITLFFPTISLIMIIDNFKIYHDSHTIWKSDFFDNLLSKDFYFISSIYSYGHYTLSSPKITLPLLS